jgi:hypothetical protein
MIPLSEKLKAEVAGILTGRDRTEEGHPRATRSGPNTEHRRLISGAAGALEQEETEAGMLEHIERLSRIAIAASRKGKTMSKSALNFMHKHGGSKPSRDLPPMAYQSIDECADIRHVLISTCEVTGYRQPHGLTDLSKESLQDALGKTIAFAKAHRYELYACKFDPSGQANAKDVQSFLDQQCIHHKTTASGTKQEMPVAEQSNTTFSQGARANLAGVQITSEDGGGRDKKWRDGLFFLAGCEAIRMTNCTHHSGTKGVLEAELKGRPVNPNKMVMGMFGCVLIFRRQHPKNKTQLKEEIGLFGGVVKSVLGQDQIICLTVPGLYGHTSREHYLAPRSATVVFPFNNDPLQVLMQWEGGGGGGIPGIIHASPGRRWNYEKFLNKT